MKKFILFILITIVVTTSYGFFNFDEKNDKKEVTSAFENYINAAQNEDVKTIHEYHIIWRNVWRTSQDYQEILNYTQKGIEAYKNVDINKYPEFTYENSRNHPMNELYVNMIEVYLKKGEKDKAIDVFNKNKKIIKYWMPPANYAQLIKKLGVEW